MPINIILEYLLHLICYKDWLCGFLWYAHSEIWLLRCTYSVYPGQLNTKFVFLVWLNYFANSYFFILVCLVLTNNRGINYLN